MVRKNVSTTVDKSEEVKKDFSVFKDKQFIRAYTEEIHGEKAEELANQFALKIKGEVI